MLEHTHVLVCLRIVCAYTLIQHVRIHPRKAYPDTYIYTYLHIDIDYLYIHKLYKRSTHPAR